MRAIIGPNGAGKTTMMDIITGKTRPDAGTVMFGGSVDLTRLDEAAIAKLGIGRKFQKPTVFEFHTHRGQHPAGAEIDSGRSAGRCSGAPSRRSRSASTTSSTSSSSATPRDRLAGSLSHGQKQWLEIGMLLAQDPKLLLVDEPAAGMTDGETAETAVLLQGDRQGPFGHRRRARHGLHPRARRARSRCCTRARCWPRARSTRSAPMSASSKSIWGADGDFSPRANRSPPRRHPGRSEAKIRDPSKSSGALRWIPDRRGFAACPG